MPSEGLFLDVTGGMTLAEHPPERMHLPVLVKPSTPDETTFNTIRSPLVTVACWKLPDDFFAFDSSVMDPHSATGFAKFFDLRDKLVDKVTGKKPPLTLFGHTDPVGDELYNNALSGRRVKSTYATLVHDVDIWKDLYDHDMGGDAWGRKSLQTMLSAIQDPSGQPYFPLDPGKDADGIWSQKWADAVKHFQEDDLAAGSADDPEAKQAPRRTRRGTIKAIAKPSGSLGKDEERLPVFDAYMTFLTLGLDGKPVKPLDKAEDFLAGNKGDNGRGDMQGCSKFNLQAVLARQGKLAPKSEKERNKANAPNRRVIAYLFKPGTKIDVTDDKEFKKWPCPPVSTVPNSKQSVDAVAQCKKRFWSDTPRGEHKTKGVDASQPRFFHDTEDTFECRFYHGFGVRSPCEDIIHVWVVKLGLRKPDGTIQPLKLHTRVVAQLGAEADSVVVRTDVNSDGKIFLPAVDEHTELTLKIDASGVSAVPDKSKEGGDPEADPGEDSFLTIKIKGGELIPLADDTAPNKDAIKQRLHNLGYGPPELAKWTDADFDAAREKFNTDHGLAASTSEDDAGFRQQLRDEYGDSDPPFAPPDNG